MLIKNFYTIFNQKQIDNYTYLFRFILNSDVDVYRGHFPEYSVAPGVCTIQLIKECVCLLIEREHIVFNAIKQCRFSRLLQPSSKELQLIIRLSDNNLITAEIFDTNQLCMKIKAQYQ